MAKKKNEDVQPEAVVGVGSENQTKTKEKESPVSIVTSEGKTLDRIAVSQSKSGETMVKAQYGRLNPSGQNESEVRKDMRQLMAHPLTAEQSKEYQRLASVDKGQALDYAARAALPMFVDDAAFHLKDTTINGRKVDYLVLEPITENSVLLNALRKDGVDVNNMDASQRKAALEGIDSGKRKSILDANAGFIGKWQLTFGEKNNADSRFRGILNSAELASVRERADVTLKTAPILDKSGQPVHDKDGNVKTHQVIKSIGAPMTMAEIAGRVEQRVTADRLAKNVDWSKFKLPEGVNVTGLRYFPDREKAGRVVLQGKVNGISVSSVLSKNESTAVTRGIATLEQVAAANKDFRQKVQSIASPGQGNSMSAAVKAVVDRASDATARAFTPAQVKTLNDFASRAETSDDRHKVFDDVWSQAQPKLTAAHVNEAWQKDAHDELNDLADGIVRTEQQGLKL